MAGIATSAEKSGLRRSFLRCEGTFTKVLGEYVVEFIKNPLLLL
jgi:hypothetical protein